jgi:dimethylglycine dehydrogenase
VPASPGSSATRVWTTPDYFATLYDELWDAGRSLGLKHFGGRALSSLRLEKAYGSFNKDFRPDYTAAETGLDRFIDFGKADFTGRDAASAERAAGPARRFVVMEIAAGDADVIGYESIIKDGAAVGYVTSGAFGHCVANSLAAGYVPAGAGARRRTLRDRYSGRDTHRHGASAAAVRSAGAAAARID